MVLFIWAKLFLNLVSRDYLLMDMGIMYGKLLDE